MVINHLLTGMILQVGDLLTVVINVWKMSFQINCTRGTPGWVRDRNDR